MSTHPARSLRFLLLALGLTATAAVAEPILIDFGPTDPDAVTSGWNNLGQKEAVHTSGAIPLLDGSGQPTGISITIIEPFNGTNAAGVAPAPELPFPATAAQDSLYGNALPWSSGWISKDQPQLPVLELSGLKPAQRYTFTFFASRKGGPNRSTDYTVDNGRAPLVVTLDAADNTTQVAVTAPVEPSAEGKLTLKLTPGDANATPQKFVYLGALKIESTPAR